MFKFKQFIIHQDKTPMKVGTDGVLLGAWARIKPTDEHILDIGCGTGLIALMMAQRSDATVDAVEIDLNSAEQARENITLSPWSNRINIHNVNIVNFNQNFKYDLIVSNPPFFSDSLLPPNKGRTTARHTVSLTFQELIHSVIRLLADNGRFVIILPTNESKEFERLSKGLLFTSRRYLISSSVGSDCKRVITEYKLKESTTFKDENLAIREASSDEYTQEYKSLTADFYLKF
ncbi:MAG: methyltransferase [Rikenellaceae bacterium]